MKTGLGRSPRQARGWDAQRGLAGKALNCWKSSYRGRKSKRKKKKPRQGASGSPEVFLYHSIFLLADPQMSMAATAAVSPSDYLQPAAATTQASAQRALRTGPEPGRAAETHSLSLRHPGDLFILIFELRHSHLSKLGHTKRAGLHLAPGAGGMAVSKVLAAQHMST